jgi:hypothetical protein
VCRLVLLALAGLLALPATAHAARPWGESRTLARDARLTSAGIDDRGTVLATWVRGRRRGAVLRAARRTPQRGFRRAFTLREIGRGDLGAPAIGFVAGRAYFVWQRGDRLEARTMEADGARSRLQRLTGSPPATFAPRLLRTARGPLVLAWSRGRGIGTLELADAPAGPGGFVNRRRYALPAGDVAVDASGAVSVAFVDTSGDGLPRVYVARRSPTGVFFDEPVAVSDGDRYPREPVVAATPDGAVTVAWSESDGSRERVVARRRARGSEPFGDLDVLSERGLAYGLDTVATTGDDVFVTWIAPPRGATFAAGRGPLRLAVAGADRPARTIGRSAEQYELRADGPGGATAAWVTRGGAVDAVALSPGGRPGRVQRLSRRGARATTVRLATGRRGDAFAVWTRLVGERLVAGTRVEAARRPASAD